MRGLKSTVKVFYRLPLHPTMRKVSATADLLAADGFISDDRLMRLKMRLPDDKQGEYAIWIQHIFATDYPQARFVLKTIVDMLNGKS